MKTEIPFHLSSIQSICRKAFAMALAISALIAFRPASAQTFFTGVIEAATDASGNHYVGNVWNTRGGDIVLNTFVTAGPGLSNPFINGPNDAQAAISIPLNLGDNHFTFFAPGGEFQPRHGMNLYFNGSSSPGISVFAPTQIVGGPAPAFAANGGLTYSPNWPSTAPGANTLSFLDGDRQITLTAYSWALPSVYSADRTTSAYPNYGSVGPDGTLDWVGNITLNVTVVPEPASGVLLALGFGGWILCRRQGGARGLGPQA